MSISNKEKIPCPQCKHEEEVTLWASINVSLNPELKEKLFQAKINQFKCNQCGYETYISIPLFYNDMDREFSIQYYHPEQMEEKDFFNQFEPNFPTRLSHKMPEEMEQLAPEYLMRPHIVFDMNELIRQILFYEKLLKPKKNN